MINLSSLLSDRPGDKDPLRYGLEAHRKPIVVWNLTWRCNLRCLHCYLDAGFQVGKELSKYEAKMVAEDVASYGVPVVLFSGGEPILREDLLELADLCSKSGTKVVLSSNGTLITYELAKELKSAGFYYVGVSLDGIGRFHDTVRGTLGAFERSLSGLKACIEAGLKTGIRFTITKRNLSQAIDVLELAKRLKIPRICFYHLVPSGRGRLIFWSEDPSFWEKRLLISSLVTEADKVSDELEILTVDNYADAPYLYLLLKSSGDVRADRILKTLRRHGGESTGIGIVAVSPDGRVHPNQFWFHYTLGNLKNRRFREIWENSSDPLLKALRGDRRSFLKGRCAKCRFFELCNGNMRVRAELLTGDLWAPDPSCYLSEAEVLGEA